MGCATLALITHIRGFAVKEDDLSKRLVPFLTLAVSAGAGSLASHHDFDMVWWVSHALYICGMMVLLTELGIQFGSSYSDAQSRIKHMEAVHYMSSRLTNTLDLRVVLLALVSDTASMLSAKFASVMLSDDSGQTLTTEVTYGLPESPLRQRKPQEVEGKGYPAFYSGHTARAFREKRICTVDDVFTDVEFLPWKVLARHDGYAVSVPLVYHDLALGVLSLFFEKHVALNDEKIKLFQTLASSASVAIVNAQLYDRTMQDESEEGDAPFSLRLAS
jgi:transcriptional regulator with GAF, ATPase, and Fis domain